MNITWLSGLRSMMITPRSITRTMRPLIDDWSVRHTVSKGRLLGLVLMFQKNVDEPSASAVATQQ
jgi:hypothetical protein